MSNNRVDPLCGGDPRPAALRRAPKRSATERDNGQKKFAELSPNKLRPSPANVRTHPKQQIAELSSAIFPGRRKWPAERLAGAPGFEPGNGGIKIHVVCIVYQWAFRKIVRIHPNLINRLASISEWRDLAAPLEGNQTDSCLMPVTRVRFTPKSGTHCRSRGRRHGSERETQHD